MKIDHEKLRKWTEKRYYWYIWNLKIPVTYWMYAHTPAIFGCGWETTKYDKCNRHRIVVDEK
jgi:hypothetical protein